MAAKIESALGIRPELEVGGGGIFDVVVDDHLVFSKHQTGSFPDEDALVETIRQNR